MENQKSIITVKDFNGKYKINEHYRPIAEALKKKFIELQYVPVKNILFIENLEDKKKKNNSIVYAQVSKVQGKWMDIIYQVTGKYFEYMIEIFKENTIEFSREQMIVLIYHEMRHIQLVKTPDGSKIDIVNHEIEEWVNILEKLETNWAEAKGYIPDLLADGVDWNSIEGPMNLFNQPGLRLVK